MKPRGIAVLHARIFVFLVIFSLLIVFHASNVQGQNRTEGVPVVDAIIPDWQITGSNTARSDYYFNKGDDSQSPYQHEGVKSYDEFNINFSKRINQYDIWKGEIFGVLNGSPYRSNDYGIVPEKLNLTREKGDVAVPFRLEMGDIFSYYTYRTMQTSLKGVQIDLQPFQDSKRKHSFLITSGAQQAFWRDFNPSDNYFNGASYLIDDPLMGKYSLNFVYNTRQGSETESRLWRSQVVYSAAGSSNVNIGNQKLLLEGEFGKFSGDHDGLTDADSGQATGDLGMFFQASGSSRWPLKYRIRYENYGTDYRPAGGSISYATRNAEGHASWSFSNGYQLRGRVQKTRYNQGADNPSDMIVYGANLTGPLGSIDAFRQDASNRDATTDNATNTVTLNINVPKIAGWTGRVGYQYQNFYNNVPNSQDNEVNQLSMSADHVLSIWRFTGSITPGFVLRKISSYTDKTVELSPTLAVALASGPHSVDYNLSWSDQRRLVTDGIDVATTTQSLNYRYTLAKHIFGVECSSGYRVPDPGRSVDYYKFGVFWTHYFDKPAIKTTQTAGIADRFDAAAPSLINVDIASLAPGTKLDAAVDMLLKRNIVKPVREDGLFIYETRVLEEIENRQRLVLVQSNGIVRKSAIIIDFEPGNRPDDMMRTFQRIRSILLDKYGSPTGFYDRGTVSRNLQDDIRNNSFIRITEWSKPGGTIRFGIPKRLDGQVRMEIQFAVSFPPYGETQWGIEEVR